MNGLRRGRADPDPAWTAFSEQAPAPRPSWLAPDRESQGQVAGQAPPEAPVEVAPIAVSVAKPTGQTAAPLVEPLPPPPPAYPDLREENLALRAQIAEQAAAVAELRRAVLTASEPELVKLACAIAERIVRRELQLDPALPVTWARDAVEALAATEGLTLALSPDLAAAVDEAAFRAAIANLGSVEVDPNLAPMRCEVRTPIARVEASLEERLATIAEDLGVLPT